MYSSYGVHYQPSTVSNDALTLSQLKNCNISYVRVQWVDYSNTVRCRILSAPYFFAMLKSTRPGMGIPRAALGVIYLTLAKGFSSTGEYLYVPDISTLRICPYAPKHAAVMGWFQEKQPYPGADNKLTVDVPLCPRATLQRVVREASAAGIDFLVGFESEFMLLKSTKPVKVFADYHCIMDTKSLLAGSLQEKVLEEIGYGVQESGIELQLYHAESAPGQFEIVTGPLTPLEAADALVHTREIIMHTAAKHGLRATFAPRAQMDSLGNSVHTHISVHSKHAVRDAEGLSPPESSFLSSVLTDLPALTALTMPIPASYQRMVDGIWAGGTYVNWGTENREAPIRLANATSPTSRNMEIRCVDATANPYISLAGILGVGFDGIKKNVELTILDCPGPVTAAEMTEEGRRALGITRRMSLSWEESRSNLKANKLLTGHILGPEMTEKYLNVQTTLAEALSADGNDEAATLTRLVEFY